MSNKLQPAKRTLPTTGYYIVVDVIDPNTLRDELRGTGMHATLLPDDGHGVDVVRIHAGGCKVLEAWMTKHGYEGSKVVNARHGGAR